MDCCRGHQIFTRQFLWKHGHLEEKHPEAEHKAQADLTVSEVGDSDRSPPLTTSETSRTQGTMTTSETSETGASTVSTPAVLEDVLNAEASTSGLTIGASEDSERQKASKDPAEVPPPIEVQAEMPSADTPAKRPLDDASAAQNIGASFQDIFVIIRRVKCILISGLHRALISLFVHSPASMKCNIFIAHSSSQGM